MMNYTHEVRFKGELFWYFDVETNSLYDKRGKLWRSTFDKDDLESFGYNLKEVSFSIENE